MSRRTIRAALPLGFLLCALASCAPAPDVRELARADDRRYGTSIFTWLVDHEPSAVVAWRVPAGDIRDLLPTSKVVAADPTKVCAQVGREHALLLLVARRSDASDRDAAEDCGIALARDAGALIVAPR